MKRLRKSHLHVAALTAACALLVGCGESEPAADGKRPADAAAAKLFDAAEDEGEVYVYSNLQENLNERLADSYADEVGAPLTIEKLASSAIPSRVESEAAAGAVRADIVISSDCDFVTAQVDSGTFLSVAEAGVPGYDDFPEEFRLAEGAVPVIQANPYGIGYNSSKVTEGEAPKDWEDLLDPKWKGKILMVGPDSGSSQTSMWNFLLETYGPDYVDDLVAQAAQFYPSTGPALEALAAGEGALLIPTAGQVTASGKEAGAPTEFVTVPDTTTSYICVGLSKDAPDPNGARLFLGHLLSEAGSSAVNGIEEYYAFGPFGAGVDAPAGLVQPAAVTEELAARVYEAVGVS